MTNNIVMAISKLFKSKNNQRNILIIQRVYRNIWMKFIQVAIHGELAGICL